jgi:hypothetical protein
MADLTVAQHDTWPPVRGAASDEDGLMDLTSADWLKFIMKSGAVSVSGTATVINPPDADGFNWQYVWQAGDTANTGDYSAELEIHWDDAAVPPQIETVPNDAPLTIKIRADYG